MKILNKERQHPLIQLSHPVQSMPLISTTVTHTSEMEFFLVMFVFIFFQPGIFLNFSNDIMTMSRKSSTFNAGGCVQLSNIGLAQNNSETFIQATHGAHIWMKKEKLHSESKFQSDKRYGNENQENKDENGDKRGKNRRKG